MFRGKITSARVSPRHNAGAEMLLVIVVVNGRRRNSYLIGVSITRVMNNTSTRVFIRNGAKARAIELHANIRVLEYLVYLDTRVLD